MKKIVKFNIYCIVILLISCNNNQSTSSSLEIDDKSDADNIILYNNILIKYANTSYNKMNQVSRELKWIYLVIEKKDASKVLSGSAFLSNIDPELESRYPALNLLEPGDYIPSKYQDSLVYYIKNTDLAYKNVKEAYKLFGSYMKNEDYEDDDWKKGDEYAQTMDENLSIFFGNRMKALEKIKPLADSAEEKVLEDHPVGKAIITAKKDLGLALEIENIIFSENIDYKALDEKYKELEINYQKNSKAHSSALKEYKKEKQYNNFYTNINKFIGSVRKVKRDSVIDEKEAKEVDEAYSSIIIRYNYFVE